jgi:Fe-S-cluster-containing dehydrogenase component/formate-dependent nitrite reductase membrane component NrfD
MANFGFAIDLRKCIGCHACTIACKAEHDIPIGVNRCWVKSVEKGTFPETRRFFLPVLCNQCEHAPCVRICPTRALFRRPDRIVDLDGSACIGCRACMEACPYDQLFIDPNTHTAEKCNFCANRVENGLLPSCVIVCPTECRIFGDLDDPASPLSEIVRREPVTVRKPEKATQPKVYYIAAEAGAIQPEIAARPLSYKEGQVMLRPLAAPAEDPAAPGDPRVDYDMPHAKPWGFDTALYLLTKSIASGALFLSAWLWWLGYRNPLTMVVGPAMAIGFIALTAVILVIDLDRPERFYYILSRPNWRSWLVWGACFLTVHGLVAGAWLLAALTDRSAVLEWLVGSALVMSVCAAGYSSFLFAQGLGRDLWQGPYSAIDLLAQAAAAGAAALLVCAVFLGPQAPGVARALVAVLGGALATHLLLIALENLVAPSPSRHHELAIAAIRRGTFAPLFWAWAIVAGGLVPLVIVATGLASASPVLAVAAGLLALAGTLAWEYIWVEAGQAVPIS